MSVAVVKSHPYPVWALEGCKTALIVFAAEFGGMNDAAWIVDAGLNATCVDINKEKLDAMKGSYPDDWTYVCEDAYRYAKHAARLTNPPFDVVSLDPFTNDFARCAANINAWCQLASRAVIIGTGVDTTVVPPAFWQQTDCVKRTDYEGGVYWTVLEPA